MNQMPDLEELFEAARRQEADRRRQQKLGDMIDRMAAAGTQRRRRPLWLYSGVAAGILLLVTVGLHLLFGDVAGTKEGPILAEKQPVRPVVASDTASADGQTAVEVAPAFVAPKHNAALAENAVPSQPVEQPAGTIAEPELQPVPQPEELLLAEDVQPVQPDTPQVAATQRQVFERTSSRLVCGSGCTPERRSPSAGNAPQMAVVALSGANTDFEVGSISF